MTKKPWTLLNFNPGDLRRGRNRKAPAPPSRSPDDRASDGSGAKDDPSTFYITWNPGSGAINYAPGAGSGLTAKDIEEMIHRMTMLHRGGFRANGLCSCPQCAEPPKLESVITSSEIISHRSWLLDRDDFLYSVVAGNKWMPGETITGDVDKVVSQSIIAAPIFGGVYSYKNSDYMFRDQQIPGVIRYIGHNGVYNLTIGVRIVALVTGTIKSWGEVIEHEYGYRSSFAKIASLDRVWSENDIDLKALQQRYGVLK